MEKGIKILVVDDEKGICQNVEKILSRNQYKVTQAQSAEEALEKMAAESFSLLISDIVMPKMNGLELLKLVKAQWPLTRTVMMTAYASTDTAMKAIRLGALEYVCKPFTPDELRSTVYKALSGELAETPATEKERGSIKVIDVDIPFDRDEVAMAAGDAYADMIGPSDMPVVEIPGQEKPIFFCTTGEMACDIFKKLGATCKAGTKTGVCPQKKAKKKAAGKKKVVFDSKKLIGIDQPFDYEEVVAVTGPEYVENLNQDSYAFVPYEEVKKNFSRVTAKGRKEVDVDIPFDRDEVAMAAGDAYADMLGPSDMPVVEIPGQEKPIFFCTTGEMACDIFKKLGATCKAGTKTGVCPQKKAKKKAAAKKKVVSDSKKLIGIDQPFDYEEVAAVTGPEYVENLVYDGVNVTPYEELKGRVHQMMDDTGKAKGYRKIEQPPAWNRILVIDDEVAVNNNIYKILSKKGWQVELAMTRDDAIRKISDRAQDYHLVLLDLKIPGVQGLELLKAIRDARPETMVIIITGYASIETAVETARLGAIDYLSKPFTPDELRHATEQAMQLAA